MNLESGDGIHHEGHEDHENERKGFVRMKLEIGYGNGKARACGHTGRRLRQRVRAGFTLIEMLVVIAIIGILMTVLASSLMQAKNHARRTKAETQLREMISAFISYYNAYGAWPEGFSGGDVRVTEALLQPLLDPAHEDNDLGLVFLNKTFTEIEKARSQRLYPGYVYYLDPWDQPYELTFDAAALPSGGSTNRIAQTVSVWFPNKDRRWEE